MAHILTSTQAQACAQAMAHINNVGGEAEFEFRDDHGIIRMWFNRGGRVGITRFAHSACDCADERFDSQASFLTTYHVE